MKKQIKGEWISGPDLLAEWKITDFELVEYIRDGLQPYDKRGALIQRPPIHEVENFLRASKIDSSIKKILSLLRTSPLDLQKTRDRYDRYEPELRKEWAIQHILDFLFKRKDVADFEAEHGLRAASVQVVAISVDDHIKQRKAAGAKDYEIAVELYDPKGNFKRTYLDIARAFGLDKDLQPDQWDTIKQRGVRLVQKGKAMLLKNRKQKK